MKVRTPIIEALRAHQAQSPYSFHVPGHKNGTLVPEALSEFESVLPYDLTELSGLDDLHDPAGPIAEAERLCADLYNASKTCFLVGGSTSGNLAMIYGVCGQGDLILVQRNCHKSVIHALELSGARVVFLRPEYDKTTGHPVGVAEETMSAALEKHPQAKAVVLTYPNYWGVALDPTNVIMKAREAGVAVLVDEAHGAHFVLGAPFPPSALRLGADIVVQSTHKMLPALTMGAWLHFGTHVSKRVVQRVNRALSMFQSSSPSYLLLASLDAARAFLEEEKRGTSTLALQEVARVSKILNQHPKLEVVTSQRALYQNDPLKVTIKTNHPQSGVWLARELERIGLWAEMTDSEHVLLVFGFGKTISSDELREKLTRVHWPEKKVAPPRELQEGKEPVVSEIVRIKRDPEFTERVPLKEAVGRVSGEAVIPYPPGVPLLYQGEVIGWGVMEQLQQLLKAGVRFQGVDPSAGLCVQVVEGKT
ncbi:aminotransferase class I/II-fold pyridoxal phosphate-dependent enzyme [Shouchella shacheensis]|uniref:aminotransferase class I/II-fold pyridoxal phosphate-dependent enzyme n=1 Tax=Shouchella shacheensis TaxID=1649580 RepID=UPI00073FD7BF|nr:aminotransferase class I/II-fold pyridoxal phosphate-dependent enzyme [Shouchella shacheensis]